MNMLQLNDLLQPSEWEGYWTFYGYEHEGLPKDAAYVVFEYYCINAECDCQRIKAEIMQLDKDGEPIVFANVIWPLLTFYFGPTIGELNHMHKFKIMHPKYFYYNLIKINSQLFF